ncbi:hypothetical protein B566_EDAN011378 [Ephemera danica]|nr:hypothetical protein B566_EDAN011378 [Ephemera danica]
MTLISSRQAVASRDLAAAATKPQRTMLLRAALVSVVATVLVLCQEAPPQPPTLSSSPIDPVRVKVTLSSTTVTKPKDVNPTGTILENVPDTKDTTQEASTVPTTRSSADTDLRSVAATNTAVINETPTSSELQIDHQDVPIALKQEVATEPHVAAATTRPTHEIEVDLTEQLEADALHAQPTEVQEVATAAHTTELSEQPKEGQQEALPVQPTSVQPPETSPMRTTTVQHNVAEPEPETARELDPLPPKLPENYRVSLEVWDGSRHFTVLEHKEDDRLALTLTPKGGTKKQQAPQSCLVNLTSGSGHVIRGVRCHVSTSLPHACFCSESQCASYVRLDVILDYVANGGTGPSANRWRRHDADMSVELTYVRSEGHLLVPVAARIEGSGRVFGLPGGFVQLTYAVLSFHATDGGAWNRAGSPFLPPVGVYCQPLAQSNRVPRLPPLAEQFSVSMETIVHNARLISYEQQHYDLAEKLVAYTWRPHLHAPLPPVNFGNFPPAQSRLPSESFRIVHDFKSGVQFRISEETGNCTFEGIPLDAPDAALTSSNRHVRLRHAQELLHADRDSFAYWGMREIRGILCDVWVASRGTQRSYYSTVEVFLSHKNWSVEMEVLNHVQRVPVGVATYHTPAQDSQLTAAFQHIATTHYFGYRTGHPAWSHFEIAPCLNRLTRLFLKLTLQVTYRELAQFNLEAAQDSLRRAVAGIAGVSPLRVTQIQLSSDGSSGEVAVWFSLLEAPGLVGPVDQPRAQLSLADAFQLLRGIVQRHPVPVRLGLGGGRQRVVQIRAGSLTSVPESIHPGGDGVGRPRRYLHATYTAGSMAGLGFSMVVIGLCLGLLFGFLLWKRLPGVPYKLTE